MSAAINCAMDDAPAPIEGRRLRRDTRGAVLRVFGALRDILREGRLHRGQMRVLDYRLTKIEQAVQQLRTEIRSDRKVFLARVEQLRPYDVPTCHPPRWSPLGQLQRVSDEQLRDMLTQQLEDQITEVIGPCQ